MFLANRLRRDNLLGTALILFGILFIGYYGLRTVRTFIQFRTQGLRPGVTNVEAIRPWMTIRYIGLAYGVPEEYIYDQLEIPLDEKTRDDTLGQLNRLFEFGDAVPGEGPPILQDVKDIIRRYQENPVATGLDDIRPWMTIRYIANGTGVAEADILEQLGIPRQDKGDRDNGYKPLRLLDQEYRLGGPEESIKAIQEIISTYQAENPAPVEGADE
jgi:hypothetical protein